MSVTAGRKRKNVLLIVVDQWRGDTLRAAGHKTIRTPNIDALIAESVTFRRHYTVTSPCGPARASLLTGMYAMNHRAVQNTIPLDARHTNLAMEVRKGGFDPALVGYTTTTPDPREWPAMDPAFQVLGDLMHGWRPVGNFEPRMEAYFAWVARQGYPLPENRPDIWLPEGVSEDELGATRKPARIPAHLSDTAWFTERALTYLVGAGERPWFLHLGYYRPHPPFAASAPYHEMYDAADAPPPVRAPTWQAEAGQHPLLDYYLGYTERRKFFENGKGLARDMSEGEVRQMRATYYGLISECDHHIGRVLQHLRETGQWDDTLIILTSDHGEMLGDHYLLGKTGYFDESFHIPLVVRDPDRSANRTRGATVDAFTESIDVMPTILAWLGLGVPRSVDGRSLLGFLREAAAPDAWRRHVHYEYDYRNIWYSEPEAALGVGMDEAGLTVIEDEAGKYVHFTRLPALFFDLERDPGQFVNRAEDPAATERILGLAQAMLSWRMRYGERTLTGYRSTPTGLDIREA
jgi:arylsulfatase A-like enzyme